MTLRRFWPAALVALLAVVGSAKADQLEYGINRPGEDFTSLTLSTPAPEQCRDACARTGACRAWTFVYPGIQGPDALCWLKSGIPAPVDSACCVSGVRAFVGSYEPGTNRMGLDYDGIALQAGASAIDCQSLCMSDGMCVAWTYVNAGVQGPTPMCWLKADVPPASVSDCCTSGVK